LQRFREIGEGEYYEDDIRELLRRLLRLAHAWWAWPEARIASKDSDADAPFTAVFAVNSANAADPDKSLLSILLREFARVL
jgi:hypothetical protein